MDDILRVRNSLFIFVKFSKLIPDIVTIPTFSLVCQACSPRGIKSGCSGCSEEEA